MATYEVNTWAAAMTKLVEAGQGTWEDTVIKLTDDIDLNDEAPEGSATSVTKNGNTGVLTIDGTATGKERYEVRNLRNVVGSSSAIITIGGSVGNAHTLKFKNIDFVNLLISGAAFLAKGGSNTGLVVIFENCRFVGTRSGANCYLYNSYANVTLTSCFVNLPWQGLGQTDLSCTSLIPKVTSSSGTSSAVANYCWFREHYTGWQIKDMSSEDSADAYVWSCSFFRCSGCYIDGDMKVGAYNRTNYTNCGIGEILWRKNEASYTPSAMNVFDASIDCGSYNSVKYGWWYGLYVQRAHKSNGTAVTISLANDAGPSLPSAARRPLLATVEQSKDAQWLYENGFDIVIPD